MVPGRSSSGTSLAVTWCNTSAACAPTDGVSAIATVRQKICGLSSIGSRVTHAVTRSVASAASQDAASRVLPQPAVAATTVTGASISSVRRACSRGRSTTWVVTGGENFSDAGEMRSAGSLSSLPPLG